MRLHASILHGKFREFQIHPSARLDLVNDHDDDNLTQG